MLDNRNYTRYPSNIPIVVYDCKTHEEVEGTILNISEHGLGLKFKNNDKISHLFQTDNHIKFAFVDNLKINSKTTIPFVISEIGIIRHVESANKSLTLGLNVRSNILIKYIQHKICIDMYHSRCGT